jgi:hypothetical protein
MLCVGSGRVPSARNMLPAVGIFSPFDQFLRRSLNFEESFPREDDHINNKYVYYVIAGRFIYFAFTLHPVQNEENK